MSRPYGHAEWRNLFPIYNRLEDKELPWIKSWIKIKDRCTGKGKYVKLGIKNLISPIELHYLWMRDKAFNMLKPTVDRINSKGHYELGNCRYVEHLFNSTNRDYTSIEYRKKHSIKMKRQWKEGKFNELSKGNVN